MDSDRCDAYMLSVGKSRGWRRGLSPEWGTGGPQQLCQGFHFPGAAYWDFGPGYKTLNPNFLAFSLRACSSSSSMKIAECRSLNPHTNGIIIVRLATADTKFQQNLSFCYQVFLFSSLQIQAYPPWLSFPIFTSLGNWTAS